MRRSVLDMLGIGSRLREAYGLAAWLVGPTEPLLKHLPDEGALFGERSPIIALYIPQSEGYCPSCCLIASSTLDFTASKLNVAGACIGGNLMAVSARAATRF